MNSLSHLVGVIQVASDDVKTWSLNSNLFRRASESGDLVSLLKSPGDKEPSDTSGSPENDESHIRHLLFGFVWVTE
jgi:argininosuccinate synthase